MELDDFKIAINKKLEEQNVSLERLGIQKAIQGKTKSVLIKIRRIILFEMIFTFVATLIFFYIGFSSSWKAFRIYFGTFSGIFILFIPILYFLYKKTFITLDNNASIKNNLNNLVKVLKEYVRRSYQFTMALIPICFIYSGFLGYNEGKTTNHTDFDNYIISLKNNHQLNATIIWIVLIIYIIGFTILMHFFTKWYLKKMYGNYITTLEKSIHELEEN
jgi:hypothetical protein